MTVLFESFGIPDYDTICIATGILSEKPLYGCLAHRK
jgi:hypothetical protein